jgi:hypothetical protein
MTCDRWCQTGGGGGQFLTSQEGQFTVSPRSKRRLTIQVLARLCLVWSLFQFGEEAVLAWGIRSARLGWRDVSSHESGWCSTSALSCVPVTWEKTALKCPLDEPRTPVR